MKKILVIEDEKSVRENIITLLTEEGYYIISASNGETGINLARTELPDLIICDIMMKGMDGYEVLEEMSRNKQTRMIPFIFLTAKVEHTDLRKGMELGADDYLFKPFKIDELLKSVESRIKKSEIFRAEISSNLDKDKTKKYTVTDKIFINVNSKPHLITLGDIIYIVAENQYTSVYLMSGKSYLIRKPVTYWENILTEGSFLRIHRSTIINTDHLQKIEKWYNSSFIVRLKNVNDPFIISKRYATKLRSKLV